MPIDQKSLYEFVGKALQRKRASMGITQLTLSKQVGLSRTSIANIEAGNQNTPLHVIYELCSILRMQPYEVFPSLEALSSPKEVAEDIANQMADDGKGKSAETMRKLIGQGGEQ